MADDLKALDQFEQEVSGMLAGLSPTGRAQLMRRVARDWRKMQAKRIGSQKNPDGSDFVPRKPQPLRQREEKPKRSLRAKAMFRGLRKARHLKSGANANEAWVGFVGAVVRIARVHHEGLKDRPAPGVQPVQYPQRELLGLNDQEREDLLESVLRHLQ